MTENTSLSKNIAITIAQVDEIELPAEILEFTIDQVLDEGLLKGIPFVGWIAKGLTISDSISDRILHHKILRFIKDLESVSEGKKSDFREKIDTDEQYRNKVGEYLILLLNKIDNFEKTNLLAICFDHFITGHLDYSHFVDLSSVIERATLSDLQALLTPENELRNFKSRGVAVSSGILEYGIVNPSSILSELPELGWKLSPYGTDLKDIFLGKYRDRKEHDEKVRNQYFKEDS